MIGSELTMEFSQKTSEDAVTRKRPLVEATNDFKFESRKMVTKIPPPKIRSSVQVVRDFPPGCENYQNRGNDKLKYDNVDHNIKLKELEPNLGSKPASKVKFWDPIACSQKPNVTTTIVIRRKPFKKLDTVPTTSGNMTSNCNDKLEDTNQPYECNELKSIKPRQLGPSFGSRKAGKFKFLDPNCVEENHTGPDESCIEHVRRREEIKEAMIMFHEVYTQLFQMNTLKRKEEKLTPFSITFDVAKIVKQNLRWMDAEKLLGPIQGVRVGDKFKFRSQLQMVGLHCQPQSGIDYTRIGERNLAISIVDSNESKSCDMLIYSGHGGLELLHHKLPPEDQKLERGNMALKNSMIDKTPVRVIRKVGGFQKNFVFVYDGLYIVKDYTLEKGEEGNMIFMFTLNRVPGQPQLYNMFNASR